MRRRITPPKREPRYMDPAAARQRRMSTYGSEYWEVLHAATEQRDYEKTFVSHEDACTFMSRYYKFRMDAIECQVAGAMHLREFKARGLDANGDLFATKNKLCKPPIVMTWHYAGDPRGPARAETELQHFNASMTPEQKAQALDAGREKLLKQDHGEKTIEDWFKQGRAPDVAAEAAKPCEHTWGMYNCLKCGKPRVDDAG